MSSRRQSDSSTSTSPAATSTSSSSHSSEKERVKKWHRKTRTGCVTCKSRRVKCDQGKPYCGNCTHIGRTCVYNTPQPIIFDPSPSSTSTNSDGSNDGRPVVGKPTLSWAISNRHFRGDTFALNIQQFGYEWLVSFCRGMENYERFWTYYFPQICHHEESLEHMELSLSARYKSAFHPPSATDHLALAEVAAKHFADAMRLLSQPDRKPSREVMLIGCIFFVTFESTRDAMANSFVHLKASQNILREWNRDRLKPEYSETHTVTTLIESMLQPILSRIEPEINPVLAARALSSTTSFNQGDDLLQPPPPPHIPEVFNNISHAIGALRSITTWMTNEAAPRLMFLQFPYTELDESVRLCLTWQRQFETYKEIYKIHSQVHHFLTTAVEAYYQVLQVLLKMTVLPNETVWGLYSDELGVALRQCQGLVLEPLNDIALYKDLLPRLAPALFAIGLLSRRLFLQRQSVQLLRDVHASCHGPEDDCFLASVIEAHIEMVSRGKQTDDIALLPMSAKVRVLKIELIPKTVSSSGKITILHTRPIVKPMVRTQTTEVKWNSEVPPPSTDIWLWPPIELLKFVGSNGLLGSTGGNCACRVYDGRSQDLVQIFANLTRPSENLEVMQSQSRRSSENSMFDLAMRP